MTRGTRGSGTGKTQYSKNKRQKERAKTKGNMSNIPPTVKSTGESHKEYEIRKKKEQAKKTSTDGGRSSNGTGLSDAEKWLAAAEATQHLADVAGERAQASKSNLDVTSTKVRSNNASSYNYFPKKMSLPESTSPMVRYDSDYEKEKKRLGL